MVIPNNKNGDKPPSNAFVRTLRKVYNPIGFSKGYNFALFFITAGAMLGFSLARFQYLNYDGYLCNSTDAQSYDCYTMSKHTVERIGMILHLATILPAGVLVVFQFVPAIRHKVMLLHRMNGYVILLLSLAGTAGALMVLRGSFGGSLEIQTAGGAFAIAFLGSLGLAYYNVKRLQLEQHRAWMLRAWIYAGAIITTRIILIIMANIITNRGYFAQTACEKLASRFFLRSAEAVLAKYPDCQAYFDGVDPERMVLIEGAFGAAGGDIGTQAALNLTFGASFWLAIVIHAVGVEIYLRLTPKEHERLRNVSYLRQVEAGMKNPGRAGLTADHIGDSAPWVPEALKNRDQEQEMEKSQGAGGRQSLGPLEHET